MQETIDRLMKRINELSRPQEVPIPPSNGTPVTESPNGNPASIGMENSGPNPNHVGPNFAVPIYYGPQMGPHPFAYGAPTYPIQGHVYQASPEGSAPAAPQILIHPERVVVPPNNSNDSQPAPAIETENKEENGPPPAWLLKMEKLEKTMEEWQKEKPSRKATYKELSAPPGIVYPENFVVPEFTKYDGTGPPEWYVSIYKEELGIHARNEDLCLKIFRRSLKGPALNWYMNLELSQIKTFEDLVEAFYEQYVYNKDAAPDRNTLYQILKNKDESFRRYTARWREEAAKVVPKLSEEAQLEIFKSIQSPPFYRDLSSIAVVSFGDVIKQAEVTEEGIRSGKIEGAQSNLTKRSAPPKMKENEVAVVVSPRQTHYQNYPKLLVPRTTRTRTTNITTTLLKIAKTKTILKTNPIPKAAPAITKMYLPLIKITFPNITLKPTLSRCNSNPP